MPLRARSQPATADSDVGALVTSAGRLRWRAPELALMMADQASVTAAQAGAEAVRLRAEVLAVFACNQLGRGSGAGGRAVRALRAAQEAGEESTERLIRIELAACAADALAPNAGLAVLLPAFDRISQAGPTTHAAAMVAAADCLARLGGGTDVEALLCAADQLYDTGRSAEPDTVLLRRGVVHAKLAAYHRRRNDHDGAESTAKAGLELIDELSADELDTGQVSGSLTVELVLAMLDSSRVAEAVLTAQPVLRRPARPAGAPAACWLRLALVSRVHLPAGRHSLARRLLGEAVADAERNLLDVALAECRQLQAQLHETCAELGEALHSVRAAYVADRRWRETAAELRTLLAAEFGPPTPAAELRSALADVLADHRRADGSVTFGRTDPFRPGWPVRAPRSRHAAPTPLPVPHPATPSTDTAPESGPAPGTASLPEAEPLCEAEPSLGAVSLPEAPPLSGTDPLPEIEPLLETELPAAAPDKEKELGPAQAGAAGSEPAVEARPVVGIEPPVPPRHLSPDEGQAVPAAAWSEYGARLTPEPLVVEAMPTQPRHRNGEWAPLPERGQHGPAVRAGTGAHSSDHEEATNGTGPSELAELLATNGFDRSSGRHRSDVAMADLLTGALMAYQDGSVVPGVRSLERPIGSLERPIGRAEEAPAGRSVPPAAQRQVRWTDLPRNMVWQEPDRDEAG